MPNRSTGELNCIAKKEQINVFNTLEYQTTPKWRLLRTGYRKEAVIEDVLHHRHLLYFDFSEVLYCSLYHH